MIEKLLVVFLLVGNILALRETDLETVQSLNRRVRDVNTAYEALINAATREVTRIERDFIAQMLSRSGFVFQEIKDLEYEVSNEIFDRAGVVEDQTCILIARSQLETASAAAGTNSRSAYEDILLRLNVIQILEVYPTVAELNRAIQHMSLEPLSNFATSNSVDDISAILERLQDETELHESLFEEFIDQILREMTILENYISRDLSIVLIFSLEATRQNFMNTVSEIRTSLSQCV